MPRLPNFRNAIAAIMMAVAALCGGGKAAAEQKGMLSIMQVEVRDSAIERHLDRLANDIRRVLREAGRIRRGKPNVSGETVAIKIRDAEDFDRAAEALATLAPPHFVTLKADRAAQRFVFTIESRLRSVLSTKLEERVTQLFEDRIFKSGTDLVIRPLAKNRFAFWHGEDAAYRYYPHGLQTRLIGFFGVIESFETSNSKFEREVGTTIFGDAHNTKKHWVVSHVPLIKSSDIVSATFAWDEDVPSINIVSKRPAKDFPRHYLGSEPVMMAMVVDDKVFETRKYREVKSLRSFDFPTGLTPENTKRLAAEIDPLRKFYQFVLLEECERAKPRDVRDMTC